MHNGFPREIITNTGDRSVLLTPDVQKALPGLYEIVDTADSSFENNPLEYLECLESSVFTVNSSKGGLANCSLIFNSNKVGNEMLVLFAPFSDRQPKSDAKTIHEYITYNEHFGEFYKETHAPNSWNQITKSAANFEFLEAANMGMPVLTIFSPVPNSAYSPNEKKQIKKGDFTPEGRLVEEAVEEAQLQLRELGIHQTVDTLHVSGASLGASKAIGAAASKRLGSKFNISSVTAQELIMGPHSKTDLLDRYAFHSKVGTKSHEALTLRDYPVLRETAMRRAIDAHGSEKLSMYGRVAYSMFSQQKALKGITKPDQTANHIQHLLDEGTKVLVASAENSSVSRQTQSYLPGGREKFVTLRANNGDRLGHEVNEYVALSALVIALNIARTR